MIAVSKPVGIALSGAQLVTLIEDRELTRRLDRSSVSFAVAGIERIDLTAEHGPTVESTVAIATLSARTRHLAWLATSAVHRDHPYNLARRVASADHLSDGRTGLLLGLQDVYAPAGPAGQEVWGGAALGNGAPIGVATAADAAQAIQKLWQSWPVESIVFDRDARIYARGEQIVHIDHHGVFDVAGPLTVPTTPQGAPVLAWRVTSTDEAAAAREGADLVLCPLANVGSIAEVAALPGSALLFAEIGSPPGADQQVLAALLNEDEVAGVVIRPEASPEALRELIDSTLPDLRATGAIAQRRAGTLRERLGVAPARRLTNGVRSAFPAPIPRDDHPATSTRE